MADTRCSNPAYALDVDVMILEYLLYNTVKKHLDDFRTGGSTGTSLIHVFDTFISLFKHNHPEYRWPSETDFSLKLLEFVVLFTSRKDPKARLSGSTVMQLKEDSRRNIAIRMAASSSSSIEESQTYDFWRDFFQYTMGYTESTKQLHLRASNTILLQDILPHFLCLSAEMSLNIDQNVNEQWMFLAAEFMLQAAWEKHAYLDVQGDEEPLKVAFAWGWRPVAYWEQLEREVIGEDAAMLEERVSEMFGVEEDGEDEMVVVGESPDWTRIRGEYLSVFGTGPDQTTDKGQQAQKWQLQRLKDIAAQVPIDAFEGKVVDFLEGLWKLQQEPLLVQIEEGRIDSLTLEEFEEFKANVWPAGSG